MLLLTAVATALEPDGTDSGVVQVSYTTGKAGTKLAWMPYRPEQGECRRIAPARPVADEPVGRSQPRELPRETSPVVAAEYYGPVKPASRTDDDPMSDPFGDNKARGRDVPRVSVEKAPEKHPFTPNFLDPTALLKEADTSVAQNTGIQETPASNIPAPMLEQGLRSSQGGGQEPESLPTLEEELAANTPKGDGCPKTAAFKPISELTTDIRATSGDFPRECSMDEKVFAPRQWSQTTFTWKASGLCHKPLYFEDVQLERYGHSFGPYVQPLISHAHFFVTVPILPYKMGVNPPNECMYTLGYYRPGSCAPYMLDPLPISVRGALWEAGVWVGGAALVP